MSFLTSIEGIAPIHADPEAFVLAFARRIEAGLLGAGSSRRSRYTVTRQARDRLAFRAADWLTAFNVGLNDVELAVSTGRVQYAIQYRRWAAYSLLLSAAIGVAIGMVFLLIDLRDYVDRHPSRMLPGLSTDQNVAIGWAMVIFWGFVWPWILIWRHKRPVRQLMDRIIGEVDRDARIPSAPQRSS
jgi:hypothetical protein